MLYVVALVLAILWILGLLMAWTAGGLLHLLIIVAVVIVLYQWITGRKTPP